MHTITFDPSINPPRYVLHAHPILYMKKLKASCPVSLTPHAMHAHSSAKRAAGLPCSILGRRRERESSDPWRKLPDHRPREGGPCQKRGVSCPLEIRTPWWGGCKDHPSQGPEHRLLIGDPVLDKSELPAGLPPTTCALAAMTSS